MKGSSQVLYLDQTRNTPFARCLDLDWRWCRYAKEKGVKISINPDAHNVNGLKDVEFGIGIARKGWLEKKNIVNTLKLSDVSKFLKLN